jgi:hypothetical protein
MSQSELAAYIQDSLAKARKKSMSFSKVNSNNYPYAALHPSPCGTCARKGRGQGEGVLVFFAPAEYSNKA